MQGIGLNTYQVGLGQSVEAEVRRINRRGLAIKVRASDFTQPLGRMSAKANEFTKSLEASNARVIAFGASAAIIGGVTTTFAQLVIQATKVEKILADINAVLGTSAANLQRFGDGLFKVARNTSQSLEVAAEAALEFSRQGLNMEETLRRTNDALILTRLTGLKAADAVKGLTAAVNGFADVGLTTTQIINKLAAVDVKFAVSADDLVNALARAGAVAQDAGVNFDQLVGAVTAAQQITARGGSVIGNSFKTIFTRIQRSSTIDRLQELGIAVKDLRGQTLPALTVLKNLSDSYDKLAFSTKAAVAEQVGGVFQINILKAALKDLSRESSIYSQATLTAANATNEAQVKNAMLQKTLASIANQTLTSVRELTASLGDLTLAPALKEFLEAANKIVGFISDALGSKEGESLGGDFAKGFARAVGSVIAGPGMFVLIMVFTKLFSQAFKFARNSVKDLLQIQSIKEKERAIQESIVDAMIRNEALSESLMKHANNKSKQEEIVLKLLQKQTREIEQQRSIAKSIAPKLRAAGVQPNLIVESGKSKSTSKADGLIPSSPATPMEARRERAGAAKAGYASGPVSTMSIPDLGRVVYNKNETVKRFRGMKQPAIMPPENSMAGKTYGNQFQKQHGFNPYQSSGYIPNFARSGLFDNWTDFSPTSSRQRGSRGGGKMRELDMAFFYPAAGSGPSASLKVYKDIVRSAEAGNPYTHIDGGSIIGPRIPKMLVTGHALLEKARASGKKIPRMQMLGELYPSMLTSKINKFASEYKDGFRPSPIDYKPGEEKEVEKYLRAMGLDPKDTRGTKLSKIFPKGFGSGLIPNFALEAMRVGSSNILRLPTSKMVTETTMSDFKGNKHTGWKTLEAPLSNIQKFATSYADEFSALRGMGIDVLQRKMYFANQSSLMDKKASRSVANTQKKARGAKKGSFAHRNQHKIAGSAYESALDKNALGSKNYKNTWEGEYGLKGITSGAGDQNAKVDFIKEGGLPIEAKYGKYTQANLLAKSIRLFSDRYVEDFLLKNGQHGLAQKMHDRKYYESQKLLQSLGHKRPDADMIKRFGLSGGLVPNFAKLYQVFRRGQSHFSHLSSASVGYPDSPDDFFLKSLQHVDSLIGRGYSNSGTFLNSYSDGIGFKEFNVPDQSLKQMLSGVYQGGKLSQLRTLARNRIKAAAKTGIGFGQDSYLKSYNRFLKGGNSERENEPNLVGGAKNPFPLARNYPNGGIVIPSSEKPFKSPEAHAIRSIFGFTSGPQRMVTSEYVGSNKGMIQDLSKNMAKNPDRAIMAARRDGFQGLKDHLSRGGKSTGFIPSFESANQKDIAKTIEDIDKRDKSFGFIPNLSIGPTRRPIQAIGNSNLKPPQFWKKVLKFTKDNLKKGLHLEAGNFDNYAEALSEYGYLDLPSRIVSPSLLDSAVNEKSNPETRKTVQHISRLLKNNSITANRANKRSIFGNQVEQALGINFNASPTPHQYPMDFIENSPLSKAINGGVRKRSLFLNHKVGDAVVSPDGHKPVKFFSKFLAHGILSDKLKFDKGGFINKTNWNSASFSTFGGIFADLIAHGGIGQRKDTPEKVAALGKDIMNENKGVLTGKLKPEKTYQLTYKKDFWNYTPLGMKSPTYDGNFDGLIPNFANPLGEAIAREKNALSSQGSNAKVYVDQDDRLKNFRNPMGLLVANTRDEPSSGSQGVDRAINMGLDPKTHGASDGFISSFAGPIKLKPASDALRMKNNLPPRGNEMSKSQDAVIKKNKEIAETGNDMMLKLMGLTTVMYAFEGAINAGAEGASEFQKVLGTLSSIVMGLSQGAMVLDATRNLGKGAANTMGKGASRMKNSIAIGKRKAAMSGSKLSGLKVGAGAAAKGTGALIKGAGGAIAGMLGPLGMAIAVLIPIFSALKENFGLFTSATERAAEEIEKTSNQLTALQNTTETVNSAKENETRLSELEALGKNRSVKQEDEYIASKLKAIKLQTKLDNSIAEITGSFELSDEQLEQLNGSYTEQIDLLNDLSIQIARNLGLRQRNQQRLKDLIEREGGFFSSAGEGLTDFSRTSGKDSAQTMFQNMDMSKVDDKAAFAAQADTAFSEFSRQLKDNAAETLDSSNIQAFGAANLKAIARGDDDDAIYNALQPLEDFFQSNQKAFGDYSFETFSDDMVRLFRDSFDARSEFGKGSGRTDTQIAAGDVALVAFQEEFQKILSSQSPAQKRTQSPFDIQGSIALSEKITNLTLAALATQLSMTQKRLSIEEKIFANAQKRLGLDDEVKDFLGVLTKDEKIDRGAASQAALIRDRGQTERKGMDLKSRGETLSKIKDSINKDVLNAQILDDKVGLRLDRIANILLDQDIKDEIEELKQQEEKSNKQQIENNNKQKESNSKAVKDKFKDMDLTQKYQKIFAAAAQDSAHGTAEFKPNDFLKVLRDYTKMAGVNYKDLIKAMEVEKDGDEVDFIWKSSATEGTANDDFSLKKQYMSRGEDLVDDDTGFTYGTTQGRDLGPKGVFHRDHGADNGMTVSAGMMDYGSHTKKNIFSKTVEKNAILDRNNLVAESNVSSDEDLAVQVLQDRLKNSVDPKNTKKLQDQLNRYIPPTNPKGVQHGKTTPSPRKRLRIKEVMHDDNGKTHQSKYPTPQELEARKASPQLPITPIRAPQLQNLIPSDGIHTAQSEIARAEAMAKSPEVQSNVDDLANKFFDSLKSLQTKRAGMTGADGKPMTVGLSDIRRELITSMEGQDFGVTKAFLDKVSGGDASKAGVSDRIVSMTAGVKDTFTQDMAEISANNQNLKSVSKDQERLAIESLRIDTKSKHFRERSAKGAEMVEKKLAMYNLLKIDYNKEVADTFRDELSTRKRWADIGMKVNAANYKALVETEKSGELTKAIAREEGAKLINVAGNNIVEIQKLKSNNAILKHSKLGEILASQNLKMETQKKDAGLIEIQNKLKSASLEEELAKQAEIQVKTKLGQLDLDYKTLAAKQKYYENTNALAEEVAKELKGRAQQEDMQRSKTREEYFQQDTLDQERNNGRTYRQNRIANKFGDSIADRGEQIKDARTSMEYQFGKGNALKGSEARLQMLQLQKEQNIEQGKTGLFADTIAVRIAETNVELERFNETLANTTFDAVKDGFKGMVNAMTDGTKSMGDAFLGFLGGIASAIHEQLLDRATKQITSGIFEMMGMDSISQNNSGGLIKGFSQGGSTGGARQTPAMLTSGEYVVRKKIVDRLGVSALDKINKGGSVDGSLESLYQQSNENSFDMSTSGSATLPPMVRFNESGHLNNLISKISTPIVQLNSGGMANPFAARESDSAAMKISKGAGYLAGSMAANYSDRDKSSNSGPEKPRHPNETRLNTMSALNIDPTGRQMTARYRKNDDYSKQYGDYLLAKYQHDVDQRNQKMDERASMAKGIMGSITGSLVSAGVAKGVQALSNFNKVVGFNPMGWNKEDMGNRAQSYIDKKGITGENFQSKDASLYNFSREGHNALARMDMYGTKTKFGGVSGHRNVEYNKEGWNQLNQKGYVEKAFDKDFRSDPNAMSTKIANSNKKSFEDIKHTWNANNPIKPTDMTPHMTFSYERKSAGGRVEGPGGIDQVGPVMLDKGEYVIRASSVNNIEKKYPGFFDRLNSMRMNEGGPVTAAPPATTAEAETSTTQNSSSNVTVNINISSGGQASVEGGGGGDQAFASKIKDAVVGVIAQEKRVGGMLSG